MDRDEQVGGRGGGLDPRRLVEQLAGLGKCGDRHAVPRSHDLVVAAWMNALFPLTPKPFANRFPPSQIVRIVEQLECGGAVFEGARLGHRQHPSGPHPIRFAQTID